MDNLNPQRITKPLPHDPFGMLLVGRNWEGGSEYRYGFNTQEQDDEVYGNGNLNSAIFWEYDTRLGRRWNVDPKVNLSISSFACFSNSPISVSDIYGDTTYRFNTSGIYLGVDGLEVNGLWGTIGIFKTTEKGNQYWLGDRYFKFNDPKIDIFQLESMKVGDKEITLISDKEIEILEAIRNKEVTEITIKKDNDEKLVFTTTKRSELKYENIETLKRILRMNEFDDVRVVLRNNKHIYLENKTRKKL